MKNKATQMRESAGIASLSAYREHKLYSTPHTPPPPDHDRVATTRDALLGEINSRNSPVIAYAAVLMSENGDITLSAAGIEPEFAPAIQSGLSRIKKRIDEHTGHRPHRRNHAGFARLLPILSAAILAATYINVVPWLDVALSAAGQVLAGVAAKRHSDESDTIPDK
ncbi:hypothetical protein WI80_13785 [Burkholderia ubonensis]|uniref:hypothetical protein n=1 Tax=Burkholderia ubonensis TaxID=101571 RepID=UPI000755B9F4|nr:hypothetical protein [Burkholderia ubonensis]KVD09375.1 hypothetical protein WI80_13785 [Burkholderia ubonensis]KVO72609.1 hypothetical protein WJ78_06450 [Burkholderia ubonensis]KVP78195.1 hypothetical protein WJ94_15025 [Burkholderia ubonensis]KVU18971.1 hypothetical protein WK63_07365 [Burkholderia ubonensis]